MGFDPKRRRKLLKNFQTDVKDALFKLAKIATAYPRLICEIVLSKSLFMAHAAAAFFARKKDGRVDAH
jgi:hypothetical protein